ncbi:MAG: hypothetical protein R3207_00115 [Oceanospirillum sp.]|nr:hypothetical protein [Oceanospirillum sp.]
MNQFKLPTALKQTMLPAVAGAFLLSASFAAKADNAVLSIDPETQCFDLLAGQNTDAGDVCLSVDGDNLIVEYQTEGGWMLGETHAWVGENADGYPQTKKGNPKVGGFPYNSGDLGWVDHYSVSIPLASFTDTFENLDALCGVDLPSFYTMAHAVVGMPDGSGGYQTETGWSDGERIMERGSWATRSSFDFVVTCDGGPVDPPSGGRGSETAWFYGANTFDSLPSCGDDDVRGTFDDGGEFGDENLATRWGWSVGPVAEGDTVVRDIYAAAGRNDITKGSLIGTATITNNGNMVAISIQTLPGYGFTTVQAFVGEDHTCTVAPGQLGNIYDFDNEETSFDFFLGHTGGDAYLAVHLDAKGDCDANGNFCNE